MLTRRETEARILIPILRDLGEAFGKAAVLETVSRTIMNIAEEQGRELAKFMGGNTAKDFKEALAFWTRDDALEIEMKESAFQTLCFNVTRCRYAEMYRALGASDLGAVFSCNRDAALIRGFNPGAVMERNKTIMAGHPVCDFRYTFPGDQGEPSADGF
ncbi:MAG TPA: hypothetical protein DHV36_17095 [Desulfobacteraceae bacterium]|nr:hypothetical protein [Desulfobacteraceae bacterium]